MWDVRYMDFWIIICFIMSAEPFGIREQFNWIFSSNHCNKLQLLLITILSLKFTKLHFCSGCQKFSITIAIIECNICLKIYMNCEYSTVDNCLSVLFIFSKRKIKCRKSLNPPYRMIFTILFARVSVWLFVWYIIYVCHVPNAHTTCPHDHTNVYTNRIRFRVY